MRTFSNTLPNSATTSQRFPLPLSLSNAQFLFLSQNKPFQQLMFLSSYFARTDHIDLYSNGDLSCVLRAGEITLVSCFTGVIQILI